MITVEDYLELMAGLTEGPKIQLERADYNLVTSLARQVFKGVGLTDRQYDLAKEKICYYKDQFAALDYNVDRDIENVRIPLRSIDRSRWIKIVDYPENIVYESHKTHNWIAVRFIFNKKLISLIEAIRSTDKDAIYDKENKIHYFALTEKNIYNIINALENKNFDVDPCLLEKYEIIKTMNKNKNNYIPGIYGLKLKNLHDNAVEYIVSDIGNPNKENLALFKDRQKLYGLEHFDEIDLNQSVGQLTVLSQKIVKRKSTTVLVNSNTYQFDRLAESVLELNRFPLLIVLNSSTDHDELVKTFNTFRNILSPQDFCVLYRKDNTNLKEKEFNSYIADNNLNNSLDTNPKIVYINKDKFPKTLLKTDWRPSASIIFGSERFMANNKMHSYISNLDLVIHFDTDSSPFLKNRIEKI